MSVTTIILVRHGQYKAKTDKASEKLTGLGRKQAKLVGKRLREYKPNMIVHSSMLRAIETAQIIKSQIGLQKTMEQTDLLCECIPFIPKNLRIKGHKYDAKKFKTSELQLGKAFKKYIRLRKTKHTVVIVCHGNVIRYLVRKFLGVNTEVWSSMDIQQCGFSILKLSRKGFHKKALISHNDVGHIPFKQRTFI